MSKLYDNPKYYEIAFSFRDIPAEVHIFEESFKRFSHIPVKSVLEVGCGNCPHMEELLKRGYQYSGLDNSKAMLEYSADKAHRLNANINLIHGDIVEFFLETTFDFVYIMLASLHVKNTSELVSHFESVAKVLKKGGLYFLDWCIQFEEPSGREEGDSWEIERDGIRINTTVSWKPINLVNQTYEETITLKVDERGKVKTIMEKEILRAIYPQEFLCFISNHKQFEFVGWWNNWDLSQPLEKATKIDRPIALIRRI